MNMSQQQQHQHQHQHHQQPAPPSRDQTAVQTPIDIDGDGTRSPFLAALADALSGALGSVVAVLAFYPIDIAKTRAQASAGLARQDRTHHAGQDSNTAGGLGGWRGGWFRSRTAAALMSMVKQDGGVARLYEGIEAKALQALMGSFVYFYAYAFIKGAMRRQVRAGGAGASGSLRPSLNLLAAALAGAVNQAFTLPLENITTRIQTSESTALPQKPLGSDRASAAVRIHRSDPPTRGGTHQTGRSVSPEVREGQDVARGSDCDDLSYLPPAAASPAVVAATVPRGAGGEEGARQGSGGEQCSEELQESSPQSGDVDGLAARRTTGGVSPVIPGGKTTSASSTDPPSPATARHTQIQPQDREPPSRQSKARRQRQSLSAVAVELYREGKGIGRFWRGFAPSLILTCNPAINYTTFDVLKTLWLRRRAAATAAAGSSGASAQSAGGGRGGFLNPLEAFLVAAAAKSLATLVTYPLIRAKVILMTSSPASSSSFSPAPSELARAAAANASASTSVPVAPTPSLPPIVEGGERQKRASSRERGGERGRNDGVEKEPGERSCSKSSRSRSRSRSRSCSSSTLGEEDVDERLLSRQSSITSLVMGEGLVEGGGGLAVSVAAAAAEAEAQRGESNGMGKVLLEIFRQEGIGGLYAGCGAQLLHTILKSALLLATKEQIARAAASAVFLGGKGGSRLPTTR